MTATAELLDLAVGLDPVRLSCDAGMKPDPWQVDVLRSTAPRVAMNCSRQVGKSSVSAVLAVHRALYVPGSLVLMLSPSQRQSGELFRKALDVYRASGARVPTIAESTLRLELANGSRVVSLPGHEGTVRGYSGVDLLIIDEAARVPGDLYMAVRPMLAVSGGQLVTLSTPFGSRGWWYEVCRRPDGWQYVEVPAAKCKRISPAFLAEERRSMGEWWYRQEYCCEFMDAQSQAFGRAEIEAAFCDDVEPWDL